MEGFLFLKKKKNMNYCVVKKPRNNQFLGTGGCEESNVDDHYDNNTVCVRNKKTHKCKMKDSILKLHKRERENEILNMRKAFRESLEATRNFKEAVLNIKMREYERKHGVSVNMNCLLQANSDTCAFSTEKPHATDRQLCHVSRGVCQKKPYSAKPMQLDIPSQSSDQDRLVHEEWRTKGWIHPRSSVANLSPNTIRTNGTRQEFDFTHVKNRVGEYGVRSMTDMYEMLDNLSY